MDDTSRPGSQENMDAREDVEAWTWPRGHPLVPVELDSCRMEMRVDSGVMHYEVVESMV